MEPAYYRSTLFLSDARNAGKESRVAGRRGLVDKFFEWIGAEQPVEDVASAKRNAERVEQSLSLYVA